MRRLFISFGIIAALAAPPAAYAQQSLNLYVGGFVPRGEDARVEGDVLVDNLSAFTFDIKDFGGATVGGEWLIGLGERVDVGLGAGFYSRTVPSIYADYTHANGDEIEQDLKLRIVPLTATVRLLPLGRSTAVQPYVGAGVGVLSWRYSESGEFVDFGDGTIFRETFVGSGSNVGPVILGGVRFPVGSWHIGGEIRYQSAVGDLPPDQGFFGRTIDLGGLSYLATFNIEF